MGIWEPLGSSGLGSGRSLGTATGEIRINTSQVRQAEVEVRNVAGAITRHFNEAGKGVRAFGKDIQTMRGEIAAVGLAANAIVALGVKSASSLQAARIQLTGMLGNAQAAIGMMKNLQTAARAAGIPFSEMLTASKLLLPTLQGNTQQLDRYLSLARRVAVLNPREGIAGAAFAINEALSSGGTDLVSLSERFQISRFALRDALAQTNGDFAKALDIVLSKMGITQSTADEMGKTFEASLRKAADAATQLAGTALEPLLTDFLTPMLTTTTEWLVKIQEADPALKALGTAAVSAVAVGAPLLLFLGQVVTSLQKIQTLSIAPALGKLGATGLAVGGGLLAGIEGARAIGRGTGNEALANANLGTLLENIKQILFVFANTIVDLGKILAVGTAQVRDALGRFVESIGQTIQALGAAISRFLPKEGANLAAFGAGVSAQGAGLRMTPDQWKLFLEGLDVAAAEMLKNVGKTLFPESFTRTGGTPVASGGGPAGGGGNRTDQQILTAFEQFQQDLKQIEQDADLERVQETARYEQERTALLTKYAEQRAKIEAEANERLLALRKQTQEQIDALEEHKRELEAKAQSDLEKLDSEFKREEIKRERDFQRQRQRDLAQHALNLLSAAARLDAKAIWEENNRFDLQQNERQEDFDLQTEERQEQLDEQRKAIAERLDEQKRADDKRIDQLRDHLSDQERIIRRDEERRLEELRAQRDRELSELNDKHQAELAQISAHEADLRQQRQQAFIQQLGQLDSQYSTLFAHQGAGLANLQKQFDNWLSNMIGDAQAAFSNTSTSGGTGSGGGGVPYAQHGGPIFQTGLAMLHGSSSMPEYVLSPETTASLSRMMGGRLNQRNLLSAVAGGRSVSVGGMQIVLGDIGQHRLPDVKRMVREGVIEALNEI